MIRFCVEGAPVPQGSPQLVKRPTPRILLDSKALRAWRRTVDVLAKSTLNGLKHPGYDCPVTVSADFYLPRKSKTSMFDVPATHQDGDLDKLQRAIGDALQDARVVKDDARIVEWRARKFYGDPPRVEICVEEWEAL